MNSLEVERDHPFSFFYFSSEGCREAHSIDDLDTDLPMGPAEPRKEATTHINMTNEEVARSTGE